MSDYFSNFDNIYFDVLKEIGNIGCGNAITSLSTLIKQPVNMKVPVASLIEFNELQNVLGSPETLVFGILINVTGDINGMMMFLVKVDIARTLIKCLLGTAMEDQQEFSEMDLSALQEIGNILSSSYLSALSTLIDKSIIPSVPFLAKDMAGAILSVPAIEFGKMADKALFIETNFGTAEENVSGYFILVPDLPSFGIIIESLGV